MLTTATFQRYGINSDEVVIDRGVLRNWNYVDEHGVTQWISIIPKNGRGYEVTHKSEVVAHLSTIQVLNESGTFCLMFDLKIDSLSSKTLFPTLQCRGEKTRIRSRAEENDCNVQVSQRIPRKFRKVKFHRPRW